MPTMYVTFAYIDRNTRWDDVDFYMSRRYTASELKEYVYEVRNRAARKGVRILEFTVFDGDKEIWRGLV